MNETSESFLHSLTEAELSVLLRNAKKKVYPKNKQIMSEGDASNSAFIINSGQVKVFLSDDAGKEIVLSFMGPGEYFGEMSLIDREVRSAGVMTTEDTELTEISQKNFRECLQQHPDLTERIMMGLVSRLREANRKISDLALKDVHERVANMLLDLAEEKGGKLVIDNKPTHQQIANVVGASREMITRILKTMSTDGLIEITPSQIVILNQRLR